MSFLSIAPYAAQRINHSSAELRFLKSICSGDGQKSVSFFEENQQFEGLSVVDAPQGRYEGKEQIRRFAEGWLAE